MVDTPQVDTAAIITTAGAAALAITLLTTSRRNRNDTLACCHHIADTHSPLKSEEPVTDASPAIMAKYRYQ